MLDIKGDKNQMGKVVVERKKKSKSGRKVGHISIEPGKEGSVVVHHREHGKKPSGRDQMMGMRNPGMGPEQMQGFGSAEEAKGHVNGLIDDMEPPPTDSGSTY